MVRALRMVAAVAVLLASALALPSCRFGIDPNEARFSCRDVTDCGDGFECIAQAERDEGLCFRTGECRAREESCDGRDEDCNGLVDDVVWVGAACDSAQQGLCREGTRQCVDGFDSCVPLRAPVAEACDGLDNDCDGRVDEDFDLASDSRHCGACGLACATGASCDSALCVERDCADGLDNDGDGFTDCEDASCLGRSCGLPGDGRVCRLVPEEGQNDGGIDAGDPDAGTSDPDAGTVDPDAGTSDSDAGVGDPDAGMTDPDAGTLDPDAGTVGPDAGTGPLVPACALP